uniref:Uncharacterized protein n=1 Tax=Lepeophtheirus salmonis TaxID=72036 RepID=A0A0K2SWB2_LEPSM
MVVVGFELEIQLFVQRSHGGAVKVVLCGRHEWRKKE